MSRSRLAKLAAVLAVLVLLAVAHYFGILGQFAEPARAAQSLRDLGALGGAAFVLAYTVLQPFGIPGTVFVFAAPLIWPWPVAFALSMIGTMGASVVGFSFAHVIPLLLVSYFGPKLFEALRHAPPSTWLGLGAATVALTLVVWALRRRPRRA